MGICCCKEKTKDERKESTPKEEQKKLDDIPAVEKLPRKRFTKEWKHASFRARKGQVVRVKKETSTMSLVEMNNGRRAYVPKDVLEDMELMEEEEDENTGTAKGFQEDHLSRKPQRKQDANRSSVEAPELLPVSKFDPNTFIAKRGYDPIRDDELSVKEGESLTRVKSGVLTWEVKSERNPSKVDLVPASMLRPKRFQDEQWYFGEMDNVRSYKLLLQKNLPEGTFLVRDSATQKGTLTLSVRVETEDGKPDVSHFRIVFSEPESEESMHYKIKSQQIEFSNSQELIIYYSKNKLSTANGLIVHLMCGLVNQVKKDADFPSLAYIKINPSQIQKGQLLGEGNYGSVFRATWARQEGNFTVALKESKTQSNEDGVKDMKREAEAMSKLRHPNIVSLFGYCYDKSEGSVMLVCEYVSKGDLHTFLKNNKTKSVSLNEVDTLYYALQVADGMRYLADEKIVHRDLAARNVLLGENQVVKIADFGLARFLSDESTYKVQNERKMLIRWTAPESLKQKTYTEKSDVWSYGIFLTELVTGGETPYTDIGIGEIQTRLEQGYRITQDELNCSDGIYLVMTSCWQNDPDDRSNFEDLFQRAQSLYMDTMAAEYPNYNLTQ